MPPVWGIIDTLFTWSPALLLAVPVVAGFIAAGWPRRPGAAVVLLAVTALAVGALAATRRTWPFEYGTLVLVLGALAFAESPRYLGALESRHRWSRGRHAAYYLLLGCFLASLAALGEAWPLMWLWVAVEATTLASVALIALNPEPSAFEASWKYLAQAAFGGLTALSGLLLMHHAPSALWAILLVAGFGTKAGLVPFHYWLPDAHAEAPAPVSALLSGAELAGVLWVLREALTSGGVAFETPFGLTWVGGIVLALGLVSIAFAVAMIAMQSHLKRLFAYSSVEHMGVVAAGIAFGHLALVGALLHVFTHGLAKSQAFHMAGRIDGHYETLRLDEIGQVARRLPWTGGGLLVAVAALSGLPPFGLFFSEWLVVLGGMAQPATAPWAALLALLLGFGLMALARRLPPLWLDQPSRPRLAREPLSQRIATLAMSALTVSAGFLVPWWAGWH